MFRMNWFHSFASILLLATALPAVQPAQAQSLPQVCDVDVDGDIDKVDIRLISDARGQAASGPSDPRDPDRDLTITSADARTCALRCTFAKCASPTNRPPIANAGPDQSVYTGVQVTLDGSKSTDPDGDPLTYTWTITRKPAGSLIALTGAGTVSPLFTPDKDGEYEFQLIVNDKQVNSAPDSVVITTSNARPVANAGPDQDVIVGTTVHLDGSASSDINGDPLTFSWSVDARPAGSNATLSSATAVMPTFTADLAGLYRFKLVVNDGKLDSLPDFVEIRTGPQPNTAPIANAGLDQAVDLGATVQLDGSASSDPDNGPAPLTYSWSLLTRPAGSVAVISSTTAIKPTFKADKAGEYVAQLIVNDGADSSTPDTVRISTRNTKPVADAGDDQTGNVGVTVNLDGRGSFDADGDPLTYQWSFTSRPTGSTAAIGNPQQPQSTFIPDKPGLYVVQLVVDDGQVASDPDTATITIEVPVLPSLSINDASITEGNSGTRTLAFTVTLSAAAANTVTVAYATADGSAIAGSDYTAKSGTLNFTAGQTSKTVSVTIRGDTTVEPDEGFFVNMSNPTNATIADAQGLGTITNDDTAALPTVSIDATDAGASEAGPDPGVMRISRTGGTTASLTVSTTRGGSATNGTDYATLNSAILIPAGAAFVDVTVTPVDDAAVEGDETVIVSIAANSNYVVGTPSSATVTIADNDSLPTVTIVATDATASEAGPSTGTMRITRSGGNNSLALTVSMSRGGSATNGTDYATLNSAVLIPAGAAFVDVTVTPIDDAAVEGAETVIVSIAANSSYVVGTPGSATVTITDNDLATVTVVATDANASETGSNTGTFTISRNGPTTAAMLVVGFFSGTATNGSDYGPNPANVNIPIGQSSATVTITPIDDTVVESDETVVYEIQAGTYIVGTPSSATVTIADNDTATLPTVTLVATDAAAGETSPNPGPGRFTFTRTGATTSPLTVKFSVGGSATSGSDFTPVGTSVTIAAGQSTGLVDINPIDDSLVESQETVSLGILPDAAYTVGSPSSGTVTIADNDIGALVQFVAPTLAIGQNLQVSESVRIAAGNAPAGGLALRIVSSSPDALLSATDTGTGAQTLNLTIPANTAQSPQFYVYSLASSGTASLTVEIVTTPNPGFSPGAPAAVTLQPVGYELLCQSGGCSITANGNGIETTAQATPTLIYIQAQRLTASTTSNRAGNQNVRGGTTINLPLALSNANLGVFRAYNGGTPGAVITSLSIVAGDYYTYFFFDPNDTNSGNGTITFTKPADAGTPLNNSAPYAQSMPVAVAGATLIQFQVATHTVGRDLQVQNYLNLGAPAPVGGLSLRLTSSNANAILSSSATAAGAQTLDITVPAGSTQSAPFYVQSLASSGTANVTVQVLTSPNPGFAGGTPYVATLVPSGFQLFCYSGPGTCSFDAPTNRDVLTTINSNPNQLMYIEAYQLNPANAANNIVSTQNVRGGFTVTMPLALTNTSIGALRDYPSAANVISQISIPGGTYYTYFYFDPNNSSTGGNGTINYTPPATAGTPTTGGTPRRQSMSVVVTQ